MKAALMSALLFPGMGQIYLKQYLRGCAFLLPVLGGITVMIVATVSAVWRSLNRIQADGGAIDPAVIDRISQGTDYFSAISFVIMGIWILSVIDAYSAGKGKDPKDSGNRGPAGS